MFIKTLKRKGLFLGVISFLFLLIIYTEPAYADWVPGINVGEDFLIEDGGTEVRQFPFLSAVDGSLFCAMSQHNDELQSQSINGMKISRDGGITWPTYIQEEDFPPLDIIKLDTGELFALNYVTKRVDARNMMINYWKSFDQGDTWTKYSGNVTFPRDQGVLAGGPEFGGFVVSDTIMQMSDGSLQGTIMGFYAGETRRCVLWIKSVDGGTNWNVVSTVASDPGMAGEGFNESAVLRCVDGSLLCVIRTGNGSYPLFQTRSTDNGLSWSTPVQLPGVSLEDACSVAPDLYLMSNGVMVLSYGRPYCKILLSLDGCGYNWTNFTYTYKSLTSGYTGIEEVAPNRLLLIGDKGANWQYPQEYGIWGKYIDIVLNKVAGSRVDLLSKYNAGQITVDSDMSNVSGAFDRSVDREHSAVKSDRRLPGYGYYTIALDRIYSIGTLGICLKPGCEVSADIYFSTDGINWGEPVKSYEDANQYNIDYTSFMAPKAAQYIKVDIKYANGILPGLNEIEIFSAEDTFENDIDGQIPTGYSLATGTVHVSSEQSKGGSKALKIYDGSSSLQTRIVKCSEASPAKKLEFSIYPVAAPGANKFTIYGSNDEAVYHFGVFSSGELKWHDGTNWNTLEGAGNISFNRWSRISILASSTDSAKVYINGTFAGTSKKSQAASMMEYVLFSSGGAAWVGDEFYIDDVIFESEMHRSIDTFEDQRAGTLSKSYTENSNTCVSDIRAYEGSRSLRIYDDSAVKKARVVRKTTISSSKVLQFSIYPVAAPNGIRFSIDGVNGDSIFYFGIFGDGKLKWHDGSAWHELSGGGKVVYGVWNTVYIDAFCEGAAKVYLNGTLAGSAGNQANPAVMDRCSFFTIGEQGVGDEFYIDNLLFIDYTMEEADNYYNTREYKILNDDTGNDDEGIVIDNLDSGFSTTGAWVLSGAAGYYGYNSMYSTAGSGADIATWIPNIPVAGDYSVYVWYPASSNRATNSPFEVHYNGGVQAYAINQQINGGQWNYLGTHKFAEGTEGYVTLSDKANGIVGADAVKFLPVYLLDENFNLKATGAAPSGWTVSTAGGNITVEELQSPDNKSMKLHDTSTDSLIYADKNFVLSVDEISAQYRILAEQTNGTFGFSLKNNVGTAAVTVAIDPTGNFYTYNGSAKTNILTYSANQWYQVNIIARPSKNTFDVYIDGVKAVEGMAFRNAVDSISRVGVNSTTNDSGTAYFDDILIFAAGSAEENVAEIIIDNSGDGYTEVGTYWQSSGLTGCYGSNSRYNNTGNEQEYATWTPNIHMAGNYDIFVWYPSHENRASNSAFTVYYNGGVQTYHVDQQSNGSRWILLGTHHFTAGTSNYVKLTANANGVVGADAIRFVPSASLLEQTFQLEGAKTNYTGQGEVYIAQKSPAGSQIKKPVVLMIHGSGRDALSYRDVDFYKFQRDLVLDNGYIVVSISNGPDTWGLDDGLYNLDLIYQYMASHFNVYDKVVLWPTSAGGTLANRFVKEYPERVAGIIGTFPVYDLAVEFDILATCRAAWGTEDKNVFL